MKLKHVFTSLGLALTMALGVGAALLGRREVKAAKADAGDTWMSMITVDMNNIISGNDGTVSNIRLHVWSGSVDETVQMHETGYENRFSAMISFTDAESVTGCQFIFDQTGGQYPGTKYSDDVSLNLNHETEYPDFRISSINDWTDGGKWKLYSPDYYKAFSWFGGANTPFVRDPVNKVLTVKDITVNNPGFYVEARIIDGSSSDYTGGIVRTESRSNLTSSGNNYLELKPNATYDFFVYNDYSDSGILEIKKHDAHESYFYYVTQSNDACEDRLYTYGYNEAFGAWSATKMVKDIVGVEEYFGTSDDFKFNYEEGASGPRRVYKIPLTVGYPADNKMIMTNKERTIQTSDLDIVSETAFMWKNGETSTNVNVARALEFVLEAEELRASLDEGSVCRLADDDDGILAAKALYGKYLALNAPQKVIVDRCEVYTWKEDKSGTMGDVSYGHIMERIGIIAGLVTPESNKLSISNNSTNNALLVVVISTIAIVSVAGTFFIVRRRKHQ